MTAPSLAPRRLVLEGVPRVAFYSGGPRCPEDFSFPSSLRAALEYLGDRQAGCNATLLAAGTRDWQLGCSYALHMVTSGLAFQQLWRAGDWEWGDEVIRMTPEPLGPFRHAIAAAGYSFEVLTNPTAANGGTRFAALAPTADEATFRARIAGSLQAGRPVLALGVIGPPECGLLTGYDEGGDVLIGWSVFQGFPDMNEGVAFEPTGEYRVRGWFAHTPALILLGERGEPPPLQDTLREAYRRAVVLVRTPEMNGYSGGLAAFDTWAAALEDDANWPEDMAVRRTRYGRHQTEVGQVAEGRWYASLILAAHAGNEGHVSAPEHLLAAAACYARIHRLMWDVWGAAGGIGDDDAKVVQGTGRDARRRIAALLREARDADAEAAEHLERAIA